MLFDPINRNVLRILWVEHLFVLLVDGALHQMTVGFHTIILSSLAETFDERLFFKVHHDYLEINPYLLFGL